MAKRTPTTRGMAASRRAVDEFFAAHPDLASSRRQFDRALRLLVETFQHDATLFLCGNGGSYADCLHISGELVKRFLCARPLPRAHREALRRDPAGRPLAAHLQVGLRAIPLGLSGSLVSAIWNDAGEANIHYAQELYAMGRRGDTLLAISTSGMSRNIQYAMAVARVLGIRTIALTGPDGGEVAKAASIALRLPGDCTFEIQETHLPVYHLLCRAVEAAFFTK